MIKLIVGNWKMNPVSLAEAKKIFAEILAGIKNNKNAEVVVCPPAVYLTELGKGSKKVVLGAQDAFVEIKGAFTGSISTAMLKSVGAQYVILGHSERRKMGETDEEINKKIKLAIKDGLKVILCVGETVHDENGEYLRILKEQLENDLAGLTKKNLENVAVAHEPIWAIGEEAQAADTPESFHHNRLFIKRVVSGMIQSGKVSTVPVLYGGSVNKKNALDFLIKGEADGLLVGRESLNSKNFSDIVKMANEI